MGFSCHPIFKPPWIPYAPSILFRQWTETREEPGKAGKRLPSEKKIAKPLFYRYIISAFLSKTIYQRAGVRVVE